MSCAVSRWDTYLSETHCKLRRSAAVGKTLTHSFGSAKRDLCTVLNIIVDMSVPLRGTVVGRGCRSYPQLRCFAACSGFLIVGPASRNHAACGFFAVLRSLQWVSDGRSRFAEPCSLCFSLFFPFMGACCAQIKGFTLGCRELVLVRPNVKPFI